MKQFEAEGKEVFIKDSSTRYTRVMTSKFATFEEDGYVMSLRTKDCNITTWLNHQDQLMWDLDFRRIPHTEKYFLKR